MMLNMETFSNWITRKFVEWQAREGKRKSIEEFSTYIGVSRPLLNMWMNGHKKPGRDNIDLLAEIFGNEIYEIMGLPRPNPYQQRANQNWEFLPEDRQKEIAEEAERYATQNQIQRFEEGHKRRKTSKVK